MSQQNKDLIKYRFIWEKQVEFGEGVYLLGNIQQLGEWKPQNCIKLKCYNIKHWIADVELPIQKDMEFKFFVANYLPQGKQQNINIVPKYWMGNIDNNNFKLFISRHEGKLLQYERKVKDLKVMSFNVRSQKQSDKNEFSWDMRKYNCARMIKQHLPSIIGLQQITINQRIYLQTSLQYLYNYIGTAQSTQIPQQIGFFYDKQRFLLIQYGFKWISQSKQPGSIGYGASHPRLFSFAVLQDTYYSSSFQSVIHMQSSKQKISSQRQLFLVFNTCLDFQSTQSQRRGIQLMHQELQFRMKQYKGQIKDIFMLGDFNLPQNSNILQILQKKQPQLQSIRKNLLRKHMKDSCDLSYTYHAFQHDKYDVQNPQKIIDHIYLSTQDYQPLKFEVLRSFNKKSSIAKGSIMSDHYPIMGTFKHKRSEMKIQHLKA